MSRIGVVAIGRNEGERLRACLESLRALALPVVYVDSGSTDGSVDLAREMGAEVVELDMSRAFNAARARNAGAERLLSLFPATEFTQFLDGDCLLAQHWIESATRILDAEPCVAVVCGGRNERFPNASIYNRICDLEWNGPPGEIQACGGDSLVRTKALLALGGFDPTIAAGEEPEFCQRLRNEGWTIVRVDADMTYHDAAMLHFGQWWRRQVRTGYGSLDVYTRFRVPEFRRVVWSALAWAIGFPSAIAGAMLTWWAMNAAWGVVLPFLAISVLPLQLARIGSRTARVTDRGTAFKYACLTMLGKVAQTLGQIRCIRDRMSGRGAALIEYKSDTIAKQPGTKRLPGTT